MMFFPLIFISFCTARHSEAGAVHDSSTDIQLETGITRSGMYNAELASDC